MKRLRGKKKEIADFMGFLALFTWIISDERRTKAVIDDVNRIGNFYSDCIKALQGKDNGDSI